MEPKVITITLDDMFNKEKKYNPSELTKLVYFGRHQNRKTILEYSDKFSLENLYPPEYQGSY